MISPIFTFLKSSTHHPLKNHREKMTDQFLDILRNKAHFHPVGGNQATDGYSTTPLTEELIKKHVKDVKGKVHTRFSPEPNGQ